MAIPDSARSEPALPLPELQRAYAAGAPAKAGPYRLIPDIDAWTELRALHGGPERPGFRFAEHSVVALRLPQGADPADFTPMLHYLENGIHVVFPAGTPTSTQVQAGDFLAFYRVPRAHNGTWPMVRTIRYADQP